MDILDLLVEIREMIYGYCSGSDLKNVACCSKEHYDSVLYIMWRVVIIPVGLDYQIIAKNLENLRFTTSISFLIFGDANFTMENEIADNFKYIMQHCDYQKLIKFHVDSYGQHFTDTFINIIKEECGKMFSLQEICVDTFYPPHRLFALNSFRHLRKLLLVHSYTDEDLHELSKIKGIKELVIRNRWKTITAKGVEYISSLKLTKLEVSDWSCIDSGAYVHLGKLVCLTELNLSHSHVTDNALINISQNLVMLKSLDVSHCCEITDVGLSYISNLTSLLLLDVSCNHILGRPSTMLYIGTLVLLQNLNIKDTNINNEGLSNITNLTSLRELNVSYNSEIDDGESLVYFPLLKKLSIRNTNVNDVSLLHISELNVLVELEIESTKITNLGISYLRNLMYLKTLGISVNRRILDDCISDLNFFKSLENIYMLDTGITEAGQSNLTIRNSVLTSDQL